MIELNVLSGDVVDLNVNDNSPTALEVNMATSGGGGGQLSDDVKQALLQIASKVAYIDEHGQTYYNDLESALYPPSPLASISAVYTQSGTVYDTDSLDSLKSDLVVTAVYEDSSQAVVTTYTLSGTLTAGTSTITVSYGGKTTTFDVTVTHQAGTVTITNTLNGCTNSNPATYATEGDSYSATITASSGYSLTGATVSVTMGGNDITSTAYSNGAISIASLTGNLVITITTVLIELVSISAVYTQSGTVYDTDSVDSLKADLVVTATYNDSSTATIPSTDYTLSGTLTVGTSTVTVAYSGKTTTFTVVVSEPTFVEWDYTDGDNGTITLSTDGGSASIGASGIELSSKNTTSWKWAQAYINIPDGISLNDKKITAEVQFDSLVSPASNSAVAFFTGSPITTARLYTQTNRTKTNFAGGTGSTSQVTDISSTWGNFSQSGIIKIVYNPSTGLLEAYKDGVLTYSNTTTVYNYDHSYGAGLIAETQRGSNSGAASVTIKHIKLSWENV